MSLKGLANHADAGAGRIVAAVFRLGVKSRADHLAGPAAVALVGVDLDGLDGFF
jgi:hypothetical protein